MRARSQPMSSSRGKSDVEVRAPPSDVEVRRAAPSEGRAAAAPARMRAMRAAHSSADAKSRMRKMYGSSLTSCSPGNAVSMWWKRC